MAVFRRVVCAVFLVAVTVVDAVYTETEIQTALDLHNQVRSAYGLVHLEWSDSAAELAQGYASDCGGFDHNNDRGFFGENLAAAIGESYTLEQSIGVWNGEISDWDCESDTCADGEQCGHYVQNIWSSTKRVGCGQAICNTNSPFSVSDTWVFVVCNYAPPGHIVATHPLYNDPGRCSGYNVSRTPTVPPTSSPMTTNNPGAGAEFSLVESDDDGNLSGAAVVGIIAAGLVMAVCCCGLCIVGYYYWLYRTLLVFADDPDAAASQQGVQGSPPSPPSSRSSSSTAPSDKKQGSSVSASLSSSSSS